jgi:hypothetical protein
MAKQKRYGASPRQRGSPSKPASIAFATPRLKLSMISGISSSISARGSEMSVKALLTKVLSAARIAEGATGATLLGCSEVCEMRPTCQS